MAYTAQRMVKLLTLLTLVTPSVFAGSAHWYVGTSVGNSFANLARTNQQITYYANSITDAYPMKQHLNTPNVSLNGGYELFSANTSKPNLALGLGIYSTLSDYNNNGKLIETVSGDPSTILYMTSYNIASSRIMAEMQLDWRFGHWLPFVNAGIGPSMNQMTDYTETTVDAIGYVALPPFKSRTKINFAYQAGLGMAYGFNFSGQASHSFDAERLAIGYRYVNVGNVCFNTRGDAYPYRLNMGKLASHDVYLSYTHLF